MDHADEFDVTNSGFFVNSSLAPVLRFRRWFMSVCNVLNGIKTHGFTDTRVAAVWHRWTAVTKMGTTCLITSFEPWTHWVPPNLRGFYKWAMDALALFNEFILKVVHSRQTACKLGPIGLGKTSPLIRTSGFGRTLSLLILIWFASPKTLPMGLGYWSNRL